MSTVNKIDIDGVQWNIEDQEARNRLTELETKTTINEKILMQYGDSFISLVTINGKKFFDVHFNGSIHFSSIGQRLFNIGTEPGLTTTNRISICASKTNASGRCQTVIDIGPDGEVYVYPILENQYSGYIGDCVLYGDDFIKIK